MSEQHPLYADQIALEENMRSMGIDRYFKQVAEAKESEREANTMPAKRLMGVAHVRMAEALRTFLAEAKAGKAGRGSEAYNTLKNLDVDLVVHLTVRSMLDRMSARHSLTSCGLAVAQLIEDELHYRAFKAQKFYTFKKTLTKAKQSPSDAYKRRHMRASARKVETEFEEWSTRRRALVGLKLVDLFVDSTNLARVHVETVRGQTRKTVEPTEDTIAWLEEEHKRCAWLSPLYLPTIIPPKPWTSPTSGGYWSGRVRRLTLVKTSDKNYLDGLSKIEMPNVYSALNTIQSTRWAINKKVLAVMDEMYSRSLSFGAIPEAQSTPLPARPFWLTPEMKFEEMTDEQKAEFSRWKQETHSTHEENARSTCKRLQFIRMTWVANMFKDREAIYFPHQLDFRGRVYPATLYLHPQGNDSCRGLLCFTDEVELGSQEAVKWLASHGAGCWGVDKVSFADRSAWVKANEKHILASAEDPIGNRFWTTAEKPWQALAFCFEWAGYIREGLAYKSRMPVQMDGTCNGLQNFSALLRDPVGARAVNLTPGEKPSDIYQAVADVVVKMVERDATNHTPTKVKRKDADGNEVEVDGPPISTIALGWLGKVNRKVCKRPVMTLAYGAKRFGFRDQVFVDTIKPWKADKTQEFPFEGDGFAAASYMGGLIWDAVGEVVVAAKHAMDWLQACSRVVAKAGEPMIWKTPVGFVAAQNYLLSDTVRLELTFGGVNIKVNLDKDTGGKLDARKQASGIAPNVIHSMDASHLMMTVNAAATKGISAFSLIHDSFGCHAGYAHELAICLREEFLRMYTEFDVIGDLAADFASAAGEGADMPDQPDTGTLDLSQVTSSQYFFA
jgi:DNA-directed RNA polymerase